MGCGTLPVYLDGRSGLDPIEEPLRGVVVHRQADTPVASRPRLGLFRAVDEVVSAQMHAERHLRAVDAGDVHGLPEAGFVVAGRGVLQIPPAADIGMHHHHRLLPGGDGLLGKVHHDIGIAHFHLEFALWQLPLFQEERAIEEAGLVHGNGLAVDPGQIQHRVMLKFPPQKLRRLPSLHIGFAGTGVELDAGQGGLEGKRGGQDREHCLSSLDQGISRNLFPDPTKIRPNATEICTNAAESCTNAAESCADATESCPTFAKSGACKSAEAVLGGDDGAEEGGRESGKVQTTPFLHSWTNLS